MRPVSRVTAMVASHLLLVNHFLFGLTYNSPMSAVHPNALGGPFDTRPHKMRHKKPSPLVSYSLAGNEEESESNSISLGDGCGHGCLHCSTVNGCLSCRSSFFLTLRRDGPRQLAFCERSCPKGYYKRRYNGKGYCASCQVHGCRECQSAVHCSRCEAGYTRDAGKRLCLRIEDNTTGPGTSMPESDPHLPPIVDPPVLLTEEPEQRSSLSSPRRKKPHRPGRRKLRRRRRRRRKQGVLGHPLPRRRRPQRRRRPHGGRFHANRNNQLGRRANSSESASRGETAGPRRRVGMMNSTQTRTRGSLGRKMSRRRRLKKKYRKRRKKILQMLAKKRMRKGPPNNSKLPDQNEPLSLRQYQPEVALARPSRHALKERENASKSLAFASQTNNRTLNDGRKVSTTSTGVPDEHPSERPTADRSEEKLDEHRRWNLMNTNNLQKNLTRTGVVPKARSRNLIAYRRPRLRLRRRRRRFKQGNEKKNEDS